MDTRNPTRKTDVSVEARAAQRVDAYYAAKGVRFERVRDKARQVRGVDLVLAGRVKVDEKCKFWGLQDGQELRNYSFEVNRICTDGVRRLGWFADPDIETDYYCWLFPKFENPKDPRSEILPEMRVELFSKKDIEALARGEVGQGESWMAELRSQAWEMARNGERRRQLGRVALYRTPEDRLPESPVNLLVPRDMVASTPGFRTFSA